MLSSLETCTHRQALPGSWPAVQRGFLLVTFFLGLVPDRFPMCAKRQSPYYRGYGSPSSATMHTAGIAETNQALHDYD